MLHDQWQTLGITLKATAQGSLSLGRTSVAFSNLDASYHGPFQSVQSMAHASVKNKNRNDAASGVGGGGVWPSCSSRGKADDHTQATADGASQKQVAERI